VYTGAFDLPDNLAAKADPALIAADEQHFAAIAASLEQSIAELSARLDAELEELDAAGSVEQADRGRTEREWLAAQLGSATGLAGRTRSFPDDGERARVAVGKAIRRALSRIADADPVIGEHLRQTVHTGVRCSYWPS